MPLPGTIRTPRLKAGKQPVWDDTPVSVKLGQRRAGETAFHHLALLLNSTSNQYGGDRKENPEVA